MSQSCSCAYFLWKLQSQLHFAYNLQLISSEYFLVAFGNILILLLSFDLKLTRELSEPFEHFG